MSCACGSTEAAITGAKIKTGDERKDRAFHAATAKENKELRGAQSTSGLNGALLSSMARLTSNNSLARGHLFCWQTISVKFCSVCDKADELNKLMMLGRA